MPVEDPIERWSEEPYFAQLVTILRRRILGGEFQPGMPLPSESRLHQEYDLSRWVIRRALGVLADEGYTRTVPKRGTVVRPREDWPES
jgi:DNA-binding GntR family transcriptional regulator